MILKFYVALVFFVLIACHGKCDENDGVLTKKGTITWIDGDGRVHTIEYDD